MKSLIFAVLIFVTVACAKKNEDSPNGCTQMKMIVEDVIASEKLGDANAQVCAADADCVSSPTVLTCTNDRCSSGCSEARNVEQHARAEKVLKNELYKNVQSALDYGGKSCPYSVPSCIEQKGVYCDEATKLCKVRL